MSEPRKTLYLTAEQLGSIISGLQRAVRKGHEAIKVLGDDPFADTERSLIAGWEADIAALRADGKWTTGEAA